MPRRSKAEAAAPRDSLLDAAEHVFFEKGYSRATLEDIARHAGVTRGALYWHFRDKADVLQAMVGWQQRGVDTLVVTSGEMLKRLFTLIPPWYQTNWLLRCRLIVVSERLATLARELGWLDITVADNADNDALLRVLQ